MFRVTKGGVPEKVTGEQRPGGDEGAGGRLPEGRACRAEGTTSARVLRGKSIHLVRLDIKEPWDAGKALITGFGT